MKRRSFINQNSFGLAGVLISPKVFEYSKIIDTSKIVTNTTPIVLSTWNVPESTKIAADALEKELSALDAAVLGVAYEEKNLQNNSVGKGGAPDRDGIVTLDACVMDHNGNCGAVLAVENIMHVAALAQDVMEKTPHIILAGQGARKFAIEQGFTPEDLLTESSKKAWKEWLKKGVYHPEVNVENHDTIGMICIDKRGNLSGACTTSGLAYKMHGRVGDSPIIGSGLYIDNNVGGAVATGLGEEVIKTVGSFLIVELMRQGKTPQQACEEAINRILEKYGKKPDFQVAYLATNKKGDIGAFSVVSGFSYTHYKNKINQNTNSNSVY